MITTLKELVELNDSQEIYEYIKEQIINLYNQLSPCEKIKDNDFKSFIISTNPFVFVGDNLKIIGILSVIFEKKLIRNGGIVCRIEDFVVDKEYRNKGIGTKLIEHGINLAKDKNAYKIILDCSYDLSQYYEKFGFSYKNIQMSIYF